MPKGCFVSSGLYVTERCIFRRTAEGVEVAPGIDIDRDILAHMGFRPIARAGVDGRRAVPSRSHGHGADAVGFTMADRISFEAERDTLFTNHESFQVPATDEVDLAQREVQAHVLNGSPVQT